MVFTSQGIHQAPTMVYPWCHRVLPITTIELLVALLHNSCCLLCASINSRLGVTCSCKSLAQCAPLCPTLPHSAGWQGVGVGMLVRHCYWGGRRHLDCESARLATLHLPACLPPCITMKHVLPCCITTESEQPAILQMPWFCWKFFNTIIRLGKEEENLQIFVPHDTFAWKMSTLWL